jgi:hypothetical protein
MERLLQNILRTIHIKRHKKYLRPIQIGCCIGLLSTPLNAKQVAQAPIEQGKDQQNWYELDVSTRLTSVLEATWVAQTRFSSRLPNPADYVVGADFNFAVSKWLVVTPSYYYFALRRPSNNTGYGHDPILAATLISKWRALTMSDRNRFIGALGVTGDGNFWVYGNRPRIDYQIGPVQRKASLFVWDEFFYFSNRAGWTRNRFAVGGRKAFSDRIAATLYYQRQTDAYVRPSHINTVGVLFELRLR